jgi:tryptophan-rich sensory protein
MTQTAPRHESAPRQWIALAGFVFLVVAMGALIGTQTAPGEWYQGLDKPPFNPPNWIFAPVWFVLYVLIGTAGWLIWRRDSRTPVFGLWIAQLALNWLWSPVFFSWQMLWPAAAIILTLFAVIFGFIVLASRIDRRASLLFVPYAAWVGFASLLNISVAILN